MRFLVRRTVCTSLRISSSCEFGVIVSFNFVALCTGQIAVDHDEIGFSEIKLDNEPRLGKLIPKQCEYFVQ